MKNAALSEDWLSAALYRLVEEEYVQDLGAVKTDRIMLNSLSWILDMAMP